MAKALDIVHLCYCTAIYVHFAKPQLPRGRYSHHHDKPGLRGHVDMKGSDAERCAEIFLLHQHLRLLERNYRCRFGEIDLIMRDGEVLVFVEVRLRTSLVFGGAAASITPVKQAKLLRTAQHYLAGFKAIPPCRFDAVLLSNSKGGKIEWIKNAFGE